jgi:hypothetical protein
MFSAIERQVLQSQVIDRIQQVQQRHPEMQQQYFESQLGQERRKLEKKVNEPDAIHHAKVNEDERNRQQRDDPREQEPAERDDIDGKASGEQKQRDHIDIKV